MVFEAENVNNLLEELRSGVDKTKLKSEVINTISTRSAFIVSKAKLSSHNMVQRWNHTLKLSFNGVGRLTIKVAIVQPRKGTGLR